MSIDNSSAKRKSNNKPNRLWILMYHGCMGWVPSMDHFCAWSSKAAAQRKIRSLGAAGKSYRAFPYTPEPIHE
jgi:hypothetical protein